MVWNLVIVKTFQLSIHKPCSSFLTLKLHFSRDDIPPILPQLHTQITFEEHENYSDKTPENFLDMRYSRTGAKSQGNRKGKTTGEKTCEVQL